jgi:hypothetical protein
MASCNGCAAQAKVALPKPARASRDVAIVCRSQSAEVLNLEELADLDVRRPRQAGIAPEQKRA